MPEPTITDAKELATRYRKRGVIVFHVGAGRFGFTSYGMTRKDCDALRSVVDKIADMIQDGTITVPNQLREPV